MRLRYLVKKIAKKRKRVSGNKIMWEKQISHVLYGKVCVINMRRKVSKKKT
jgi:hypothetical protein